MSKFFKIIPLLFITSCSVITFKNLSIKTNINSSGYLTAPYLTVNFNLPVTHSEIEKLITLKKNGSIISPDIDFFDNAMTVIPDEGWINNCEYAINIYGSIHTSQDGNFEIRFSKKFIYGQSDSPFILNDKIIPDYKADTDSSLTFIFNKPVDVESFEKSFSLLPYTQTTIDYIDNNKKIRITPVTEWLSNTSYRYSLSGLISEDGTLLSENITDIFLPVYTSFQPELISINSGTITTLSPLQYSMNMNQTDGLNILNIKSGDALIFTFNKQMDFSSVKNGLTITPSIPGKYLSDKERIIFIPDENLKISQLYKLHFSQTIKDTLNIPIHKEQTYCFIPDFNYLQIQRVSINNKLDVPLYKQVLNDSFITNIEISNTGTLFLNIIFDKELNSTTLKNLDRFIYIQPYFPKYTKSPVLTSIQISDDNKSVIYQYSNLSVPKSSSSINTGEKIQYKISIRPTELFPCSINNEYLKEELCTIIQTL